MAKGSREASIVVKVDGADASRQELKQVRDAIEGLGDGGKQSAQKVVDATEAIQRGYDRVEKKVSQGKIIQARDVNEMALNIKRLEREYIALYGSIENAPVAIQRSWAQANAQVKSVETEVVRSTKAIEDQKNVTNQAGASWTGWGNAIDNVSPKLGTMVAKLGTIAAAFTAGWTAGQQLNKLFGTDMSEWEAATEGFGARANAIIKAVSDNVIAAVNVVVAAFSFNWEEVKRANAELNESGARLFDVLSDGGKRAAASAAGLTERMKEQTEATKVAAEEAKKHEEALAKTAAGYAALGAAMDKTVEAIGKQNEAMKKNQAAALDAEHVVINRKKDMDDFARGIDTATAAFKDQTAEVAALTAAHGANDPMTLQAIQRQDQLEHALETAKNQYDTAKSDVDDYSKKQADATKSVNDAAAAVTRLGAELGAQQLQLIGVMPLAEQYASAVAKTATHGEKAATATEKLTTAATAIAGPAAAAGASVDTLANGTERVSTAMGSLKTNTDAAVASLTRFIATATTAIAKINELDAATERAAGGEEGPAN